MANEEHGPRLTPAPPLPLCGCQAFGGVHRPRRPAIGRAVRVVEATWGCTRGIPQLVVLSQKGRTFLAPSRAVPLGFGYNSRQMIVLWLCCAADGDETRKRTGSMKERVDGNEEIR